MDTLKKAEVNVMGAVFLKPSLINEIIEKVDLNAFSYPNDKILNAIRTIISGESKNLKKVSVLTILDFLNSEKVKVDSGYLRKLAGVVTSESDFRDSLAIICDNHIRSKMVKMIDNVKSSLESKVDIESALADIDFIRSGVTEELNRFREAPTISDQLDSVKIAINKVITSPETVSGIPSGFPRLDFFTGGFGDEFIIIGGRPSMGKTALALDICVNSLKYYGKKPGMFSYEMSAKQLLMRLVCTEIGVSFTKLKKGAIRGINMDRVDKVIERYKQMDFYIDDNIYDLDVLISKIETARELHKIDYAVVDYVQLIPVPPKFRARSREEEVANISKSLKALTKRLEIPIIAIAQLSRAAAKKKGNAPSLDDLRESGALEQDADLVIFVHRPFYYGIIERKGKKMRNVAELIIAKQRNGPIGVAEVVWDDTFGHFENPAMRWVDVRKPSD